MVQTQKSELEEILIEFAKEHPQIKALSLGNDPEAEIKTYWILTERYDLSPKFNDEISMLDLKLTEKYMGLEEYFQVMQYTLPEDEENKDGFLGHYIWKR